MSFLWIFVFYMIFYKHNDSMSCYTYTYNRATWCDQWTSTGSYSNIFTSRIMFSNHHGQWPLSSFVIQDSTLFACQNVILLDAYQRVTRLRINAISPRLKRALYFFLMLSVTNRQKKDEINVVPHHSASHRIYGSPVYPGLFLKTIFSCFKTWFSPNTHHLILLTQKNSIFVNGY